MATLADRFIEHAADCERMGAPLYTELMRGMAADWEAGGIVREICSGWADAPEGAYVQLRFLGGLHRLVLAGLAPELVPFYRNLGGDRPAPGAWPVAREVVVAHAERLRADLDIVPQTNEIGRSVGLVVALTAARRATGLHRVRLLEAGASAGLNLRVDAFRIGFGHGVGSWWWGPDTSPVVMEDVVDGLRVEPAEVDIVERRGCDLHPVDPVSAEGALRLRSFVWPDHVARYHRLEGALAVAAETPVVVDAAEVTPWLRDRLAEEVEPDVLTVVWHSVVWQYLTPAARAEADEVIAAADRTPLAHVQIESANQRWAEWVELTMTTHHGGRTDEQVLAMAPAHGFPLRPARGSSSSPRDQV